MMSEIAECGRGDSVRIYNPNDRREPLSVTIPVELIFCVDALLREVLTRGETSPALEVERCKNVDGTHSWMARLGGLVASGCTPWAAMSTLGRVVLDRGYGECSQTFDCGNGTHADCCPASE